jgi:Transposase.
MFRFPGPLRDPEGDRSARRKSTAAARGARPVKRKTSVVLELLRGADLESTSRKYGVTAATLTEWRDAFLAAGAEALKARQEAQLDEQGRRMKSVIAEMAMENELLRERIRRMEDEKPFLRWRSRK